MISRDDFVFTIGYDGATAIVDGKAKKENARLSTMELAGKGLYRAAFSSALYSGSQDELKAFFDYFNAKAGTRYTETAQFCRLFGVNMENVSRVLVL